MDGQDDENVKMLQETVIQFYLEAIFTQNYLMVKTDDVAGNDLAKTISQIRYLKLANEKLIGFVRKLIQVAG